MQDSLLHYYERELTFLRKMGQEFAEAYPKVASRLQLEPGKCEDPHVERLIQAVALLAARVHHKIDDEFPEITEALLGMLYPHLLAPIPSLSIVQCVADAAQGGVGKGYHIARGTVLYSKPVQGTQCRFRTCFDTTLWPIDIVSAQVETPEDAPRDVHAVARIRVVVRCHGKGLVRELGLTRLRMYLHGDTHLVYPLYELLVNNVCAVQLREPDGKSTIKPITLPSDCLKPVGFAPDEGLLPYGSQSLMGYRLIQEYFAFPQKFLFVDLHELDQAVQAGFGSTMEILIFLTQHPQLERAVDAGVFRLGCTPIVNLFSKVAEPIRVDHTQSEYRVIPDLRRQGAMEVYSIDSVTCTSAGRKEVRSVQPFYTVQQPGTDEAQQAFWIARRRQAEKKGDAGTEMDMYFVDRQFNPAHPPDETLTLRLTCSNRDLPGKLPFSEEGAFFEMEGGAPLSRIRCLVKPTPTLRPSLKGGTQWSLISHLSLNYLSLIEGGQGALQEMLRLYDYSNSPVVRQHIAGITGIRSRRVIRRPHTMGWNGFCRGLEVTMQFDEDKYVGSGLFLFASVLERFLGLYTAINSFTQFVATTQQRQEALKRWPPRAGEQILV